MENHGVWNIMDITTEYNVAATTNLFYLAKYPLSRIQANFYVWKEALIGLKISIQNAEVSRFQKCLLDLLLTAITNIRISFLLFF